MKIYEGKRHAGDTWDEAEVLVNGQPLPLKPSQKIWDHSPSGFSWGYGGSGPAQLALAILLDYLGDADSAARYYQAFKWRVVAQWPQTEDWRLTGPEIDAVLAAIQFSPSGR